MSRFKNVSGQSLFEIIVAIGVAALIIGSTTTAIVISLQSDRNNIATQKAYAIAEEMLSNVGSYAEANWGTLYRQSDKTSSGQYHLEVVSTSSTSTRLGIATGTDSIAFSFSATSTEENLTYTTWFHIEDIQRNTNQAIVTSGGTNDPSTQSITAHVSWTVSGDTREIELTQILSNTRSFTAKANNWGGSSGSTNVVTEFGSDYFSKTSGVSANATSIEVGPH